MPHTTNPAQAGERTPKDTSARILEIRAKAGNPNTTCPTCGHKPAAPYRQYDKWGKVTAGCIDAAHTGHLVTPSECQRWHNRPEAIKLRRAELTMLKRK